MIRAPWTLAVDPGLRLCGVALFEGQALHSAWLIKNTTRHERGPEAWHSMGERVLGSWLKRAPARGQLLHNLVIEVPQIYWNSRKGGRAADLIELAGVVGAVSSACPVLHRVHFLPKSWKGQTPKEVHNSRVLKKLSEEESGFLEPTAASLRHNMIDAVGLGLFRLGRLTRKPK